MDFNVDKPIFLQVAEFVENQILDEYLKPGDQTPSTNDFQKIYEINPATARKGLSILVEEGIIFKKRGMGMYVTDDAKNLIIEKRQREFFDSHIPQLVLELRRLNISTEKLINEIEKIDALEGNDASNR